MEVPCRGNQGKLPHAQHLLFLFLFTTMCHSNQDKQTTSNCDRSDGFHRCGNSTQCLHQTFWCDNTPQCLNGADENNNVCARKGSWSEDLAKQYNKNKKAKDNATDFGKLPKGCAYDDLLVNRVICSGRKGYIFDKRALPTNITQLQIEDVSFEAGPRIFSHLTRLEHLILLFTNITQIWPETFQGLHKLTMLSMFKNEARRLPAGTFVDTPHIERLWLQDNGIHSLENGTFKGMTKVTWIDLRDNSLQDSDILYIPDSVRWLDMENNLVSKITRKVFSHFPNMTVLILKNNLIGTIEPGAFTDLKNLLELDIAENEITSLPGDLFSVENSLQTLYLEHNIIDHVPTELLGRLSHLKSLNLSGLPIGDMDMDHFKYFQNLSQIAFWDSRFYYCLLYAPHATLCEPKGDGVSSMDNLLDQMPVRVCIWIVALLTCLGNIMVMVSRFIMKQDNRAHSIIIKNLCCADFLMGVYLFIIAVQDVRYRDRYRDAAYTWVNSILCRLTGLTAMLSCEVSLLILTVISLQRYLIITHPYKRWKLTAKTAYGAMTFVWTIGITIAVSPILIMGKPFLYPKIFYGNNGLCFPLHIRHPYEPGWQSSTFIFLGINMTSMITISFCYVAMYLNIMKTRRGSQSGLEEETDLARRLFWIILTDALCWIPIFIVKTIALCGFTISASSYRWISVFVLPINSALNPFIYSISAPSFLNMLRSSIWGRRFGQASGLSSSCMAGRRESSQSSRSCTFHTGIHQSGRDLASVPESVEDTPHTPPTPNGHVLTNFLPMNGLRTYAPEVPYENVPMTTGYISMNEEAPPDA